MVNRIVSLISLSNFSLLVYRSARDFYVLILYPVTLLYSLISTSNFLLAFLGFSMKRIMSSENSESVTSFPVWIPFFFFFVFSDCLAKTSKIMFNSSGESEHPWFVPGFRRNVSSVSPLRIIFAAGLLYMAYQLFFDFFI